MKADDAKKLKEFEKDNSQLKRVVADKELEILALREIDSEILGTLQRRLAVEMLQRRLGISERRVQTFPRSARGRRS